MANNNIVEILALQNKVAEMEQTASKVRATNPNHPGLRQFELDLAYTKGQLNVWLQVAEDFSRI